MESCGAVELTGVLIVWKGEKESKNIAAAAEDGASEVVVVDIEGTVIVPRAEGVRY